MEKYGVENLKKCLDVALEGGNVLGAMKAPGNAGAAEFLRLTDEIMALPSVEYKQLDDELKDLSAEEVASLHAHIAQKLDIPQDKVEAVAEQALLLALKIATLSQDAAKLVDLAKAAVAEPPKEEEAAPVEEPVAEEAPAEEAPAEEAPAEEPEAAPEAEEKPAE